MGLLEQYLRYRVEVEGIYRDNRQGICLWCLLSPLMGALLLKPVWEKAYATSRE
jgi:hypothetical protein